MPGGLSKDILIEVLDVIAYQFPNLSGATGLDK